jgi:RimJ/RimL family protein N-acetyltransferase
VSLPRLSGERVTLVPTPHAVAAAVLHGDPAAGLADLRLIAAHGWPHDDTVDGMRGLADHGAPGDESGWLITVDGEVVGDLGWFGGPDPHGDAEIGYGLAPGARGRGIGTEAVGLLCAWCERQPGVRRVIARVLPGNEQSWRVLTRLGFVQDGDEPPYHRYVRDAPHMDASGVLRLGCP